MNSTLLERLRTLRIPAAVPMPKEHHFVARLEGVDFGGIFDSPDLAFERPFDARFAKLMVRTVSHLLGGDACGRYGFAENFEFSVLLDRHAVCSRWHDATDLQNFLVALASTRLSALVDAEALFRCDLYAFAAPELIVAYFGWRQQEASSRAMIEYCSYVLSKDNSPEQVAKLVDGLGFEEMEEILRQNNIEYSEIPAWQRGGAGVHLTDDGKVSVNTDLPRGDAYGPYLRQYVD